MCHVNLLTTWLPVCGSSNWYCIVFTIGLAGVSAALCSNLLLYFTDTCSCTSPDLSRLTSTVNHNPQNCKYYIKQIPYIHLPWVL